MGTAIKINDMTIIIMGSAASNLRNVLHPPTLNGLSVSGSMERSLRNAGNTGRYASRNITKFSAKKLQNKSWLGRIGARMTTTLATIPFIIAAPTGMLFLTLFLANTSGISLCSAA